MHEDAAERPSRPRQLIVCCDGTNNTLTAGSVDTNVIRLQDYLLKNPARKEIDRVMYYDPGVGSSAAVPPAGPVDWLVRTSQRISGLASGQGIFENIGDGYLFLMRNWRNNDDRVFCFGFSRGAFTARCIVGMVNLFGIIRPEHEALIPMLVHIYFSPEHDDKGTWLHRFTKKLYRYKREALKAGRTNRSDLGAQVRTLFASEAGKVAEVFWVGVWDTVEAVGLPGPLSRQNPNEATFAGKRIRNARHALSFDEHRWTFEPRLYSEQGDPPQGDIDHPDQTLKQRWFHGVHCDVGGGYMRSEVGLSDRSLQWMIDELAPHLDLATPSLPSPQTMQTRLRHDPMWDEPFWALAGMRVRNMRPTTCNGDPIAVIPGPMTGGDKTVWSTLRKPWPVLVASLACVLSAMAFAACLAQGDVVADSKASIELATRAAIGFAIALFSSIDGGGFFVHGRALWDGSWSQSGWAAFWLIPFTMSWGYLLARIASRAFAWLVGQRMPGDPMPSWVRFGMAPLVAVGSGIGVTLSIWAALALHGVGVHSIASAMVWSSSAFAWSSVLGLVACIPFGCVRMWIIVGSKTRYLEPTRLIGRKIDRTFMAIVFALPLLIAVLCIVHHVAYRVASARDAFCGGTTRAPVPFDKDGIATASGFSTNRVCWSSGIEVEQGRSYEVTLTSDGAWLDLTKRTDVAGLPTSGIAHWFAFPLKRYWTLDWFAPVLRIGDRDGVEMPMTPYGPRGRYAEVDVEVAHRFAPLPQEDVDRIMQRGATLEGPRVATARFTADRSGALSLFVNDALILIPKRTDLFYRNNHGAGTIVVRRIDDAE